MQNIPRSDTFADDFRRRHSEQNARKDFQLLFGRQAAAHSGSDAICLAVLVAGDRIASVLRETKRTARLESELADTEAQIAHDAETLRRLRDNYLSDPGAETEPWIDVLRQRAPQLFNDEPPL